MCVKESRGIWGCNGEEKWKDCDKDRERDKGEEKVHVSVREQTVRGLESQGEKKD